MFSSLLDPHNKGQWIDRGWYLVTEFERTPSINFQWAVELAQSHPEFTPLMDERNVLIYRNIYRKEQLREFQEMYQLIKNWKGAKLYIKGEGVEFDMIGQGIQCYIQTVLSHHKVLSDSTGSCHSFPHQNSSQILGCIGCRRSYVSKEWENFGSSDIPVWFAFGRLDHNQVYQIHKEDLESAVIGELIEYHYCPLLDLDDIRTFIRELPERIDPRKDREWRYNRKRNESRITAAPNPRFNPRASREPAILPVSEEAYRAYLQRKHVG